jgi:AsmA-like C-terminal region/Protein of unknown function
LTIRPVKIFLKSITALIIVVALVVAAGFWRLSVGPVSLSILVGTVENLINENFDDLTVSFEDMVLEKDKESGVVQFRFIDLRVRDSDNSLVARTSRLAFRMSMGDLIGGTLSPTHLELLRPKMFVHRKLDGSIRLGFGEIQAGGRKDVDLTEKNKSGTGENETSTPITTISPGSSGSPENVEDMIALLQATLLSDDDKGPGARLRQIEIINAALTLYDEPNATTWVSPKANVTMTRARDGLTASVEADIKVGRETFSLNVQSAYSKSTQRIKVDLSFKGMKPETLAKHVPDLEVLKFLRLPVSGSASAEIALDGKMLNADIDIKLGAGKLIFSEDLKDEIGVSAGRILAKYNQEKRLLVIEPSMIDLSGGKATLSGFLTPEGDSGNPFSNFSYNLELANIKIIGKKTIEIDRIIAIGTADSDKAILDLETTELHAGEARIRLSGTVNAKGDTPEIKVSGNIENIATAKLLEIWPLEAARGLRVWIDENLDAFVPRGSFEVDIDGQDIARLIDGSEVPKGFLNAEFEVSDATVRYFEGLPSLRQAFGRGILVDSRFEFIAEGGEAIVASGKKVQLTTASFITDWAVADPAIGIVRASVKGSTSAVMELLDNDPLNFGKKMGVDPKTIGGEAVGDLVFTMPLLADLPVEKVDIKAKAKLIDVKLPKAFGDFDVTKGNLDLDITMFGLKGTGTLNLKGTKTSLVWAENFGVRGKRSSEFKLKTVLDDAARKRMGLKLSTFMSGPATVSFVLKGTGSNLSKARVVADLTKATLFRKRIGWVSPPGAKTTARLDMKFNKGGAIDIRNIEVISKERKIFVTGNLGLNARGEVSRFDLPEIRLGPLNLYSVSANRNPAGTLEVAVKGKSFDARPLIVNALNRDKKVPAAKKDKDLEKIVLIASFDTVYAHNKQVFKGFSAQINSVGADVIAIRATASVNGKKPFRFDYGDKAGTPNNLKITSEDAGAVLKAFDLYSKIQQGQLDLEASISPAGSDKPTTGRLKIKQFDIANDARLKGLTQTIVNDDQQIQELLRESVSFTSFRMPFQLLDGRLMIGNSILKGAVLGASGRGIIDTKSEVLNIEGTLIPIYAVNSIVGNIPVLGQILVGRKGEGIFGVTFSLRGTMAKPVFSINPASVLAPGFLRQFFEKGTPGPETLKPKKSAPISLQPKPKPKEEQPVVAETSEN